MSRNKLLDMHNRLAALERRLASMIQHGPVAEVNEAEGWVRQNLGEGDDGPLLGPRVKYAQVAGGLKIHAPPIVGQNMTTISPTGDPRQAIALPMTWSNENPSPGDGPEPVLTYGDVRITIEDGGVRLAVGGFTMLISGAGLAMAGGGVGHDGKNIGADHTHPGVERGGADTDPPKDGGPQP